MKNSLAKVVGYLVIVGGSCYLLLLAVQYVGRQAQRLDSISTAKSFTRAMQGNDLERARQLSNPLLWDSLESWQASRELVHCTGFSIEATEFVVGGPVSGDPESQRNSISINEPCRTEGHPDRWYCILANDIILTKKNNGLWEVTSFGTIEESFTRGLC